MMDEETGTYLLVQDELPRDVYIFRYFFCVNAIMSYIFLTILVTVVTILYFYYIS